MALVYMLDTDTASYLIRGGIRSLDEKIATMPPEKICISSITRAELLYGVHLKEGAHRLAQLVGQFLSRVHSLPWDNAAADRFAIVATELTKNGTLIGSMDTMIAAHALAAGATLVTNNARHFSRITELDVENWSQSH